MPSSRLSRGARGSIEECRDGAEDISFEKYVKGGV